jgi:hypothetical protein
MRYVTFRIPLPLPPGPVRINWRRVRSHAIDVAFLVGVSILAALGAALWPSWTMTWGWAGGATVSGILYYRGLRRSPVQYFASARTAIERIVRDSLGFRGWSAPRCFPRGPDEGPHAAYGPFRIVPLGDECHAIFSDEQKRVVAITQWPEDAEAFVRCRYEYNAAEGKAFLDRINPKKEA